MNCKVSILRILPFDNFLIWIGLSTRFSYIACGIICPLDVQWANLLFIYLLLQIWPFIKEIDYLAYWDATLSFSRLRMSIGWLWMNCAQYSAVFRCPFIRCPSFQWKSRCFCLQKRNWVRLKRRKLGVIFLCLALYWTKFVFIKYILSVNAVNIYYKRNVLLNLNSNKNLSFAFFLSNLYYSYQL